MKIGIITDIHSNIYALNAVLQEFDKLNINKIICLGDMIGIGLYPEETMQELLKIKDKLIIVRGNHEQYLLNGLPEIVHDEKTVMPIEQIKHHKWIHSKLSENTKDFISTLSASKIIEIENKKILAVHYPMNEKGEYKKHIKKANIEEIEELFSNVDADIFLYGHTHIANVNNRNNKWYINPGSLGCPNYNNSANAGILIIEKEKIQYEQLNVKYDVKKVIEKIKSVKYPDYDEILKIFYGVK